VNASTKSASHCVIAVAMFLSVSWLTPPSTLRAGDDSDSVEVSQLLNEAKDQAIIVEKEASTMQIYSRQRDAWESKETVIEQVKQDTNNLEELARKLDSMRMTASPSQQETIGRVDPVLREMASSINSTIEHLDQNAKYLHTPTCKEYVTADSELAGDALAIISDSIDFEEERARFEELGYRLDAPR
jgi:hypothetical protein